MPFLEARISPDFLARRKIELHRPFLVVGPSVLGLKELAAAARREDFPANVAEVGGLVVQVEGRDAFSRFDLSLPHRERPESVRLQPLLELRPHESALMAHRMAPARNTPSQDQIIESG